MRAEQGRQASGAALSAARRSGRWMRAGFLRRRIPIALAAVLLVSGLLVGSWGCGGSGGSDGAHQSQLWVLLDAGLLEPVPDLRNVLAAVDSAADAGAAGVVVEVKTRTGESLVPTSVFPEAHDVLKGLGRDFVQQVLQRCQERGLQVALEDHVFYGGNARMQRGVLYEGASDWSVVRAQPEGLVADVDNRRLSWARLCPVHPDVRKAELRFVRELADVPGVHAVWLEGVGFPDLWSDFSPAARAEFESWLERKLKKWPDDVLVRVGRDDSLRAGPYLRQWLLWRALVAKRFVEDAKKAVESGAGKPKLAMLVGGWLPRSFHQGVNWAPENYSWTNRWLPPDYGSTSCLQSLDVLGIGVFFPYIREKDAKKAMRAEARAEGFDPGWFSVQGCVKRVARFGATGPTIAGVVHAGIWGRDQAKFKKALEIARKLGTVLVLDASTLTQNRAWRLLRAN